MQIQGTTRRRDRRLIVAAAALFLLSETAVLGLNYRITWHVERDALAINLAGRQRMLSQRMAKAVFAHGRSPVDAVLHRRHFEELRRASTLFDATLTAFLYGGTTINGAGETVFLERLDDRDAMLIATRASLVWLPFRARLREIVAEGGSGPSSDEASAYAAKHNVELLDLMNLLTSRIERAATERTARLRLLQGLAFLLALLNFFVILGLFNRELTGLSGSYRKLSRIIDNIGASVLAVDGTGTVIMSNTPAERLFGYRRGELIGLSMSRVLSASESGMTGWRKDGGDFVAALSQERIVIGGEEIRLLSVFDVTRQRETEAQLEHMAHHDPLTGLPNRALLEDRLRREVARARRRRGQAAVAFIDLDGFKGVNDRYGHRVGDLLLEQVADRLETCSRDVDTVSRLGGDEFVVLLCDAASRRDITAVTGRVLDALSRPFRIEGRRITVGASIGVSRYPTDAQDPHTLLRRADAAMYRAKANGGLRIEFCAARDGDDARPDNVYRLRRDRRNPSPGPESPGSS